MSSHSSHQFPENLRYLALEIQKHSIVSIEKNSSKLQSQQNFPTAVPMASLLFSLAAASLASSVSAAATSGDFNILSFNVAGLPAILNDNSVPGDKATNAGTIGTLFTEYDYDVINVQEGANRGSTLASYGS
jgi:hypothetical protein